MVNHVQVCVGTGVQLWAVSFLVLFFSMARLVSPVHKGDMLTVGILIYVLIGGVAGYNAARIHRRFRGTEWLKVSEMSSFYMSTTKFLYMYCTAQCEGLQRKKE